MAPQSSETFGERNTEQRAARTRQTQGTAAVKSTAARGSALQSTSSVRAAPATAPRPGRTHLTGLTEPLPAAVPGPKAAAAAPGSPQDDRTPRAGSGTAGSSDRHFRLAPPASAPHHHVAPAGLPGNVAHTRRRGRRPWRRGRG